MPEIRRTRVFDLLARKSLIYERLSMNSDWIDLDFIERERTPQQAVELDIQMRVAGLSPLNTTSVLEDLGVEHGHEAVHNWVRKADLQPNDGYLLSLYRMLNTISGCYSAYQ